MRELSARDKVALLKPVAVFRDLLLVDSVWSAAVEEASLAEKPELDVARDAVGRLDDLLVQAVEAAKQCRSILLANQDLLSAVVAKIGASDHLSAEQRERWLMHVQRAGGPTAMVTSALEHIERESPREREDIKQKVEALAARGSAPGDVSMETACHVGVAVTVTLAVIGAWPEAFVAGAISGYACGQAHGPLF